jgi:hypothetical protein
MSRFLVAFDVSLLGPRRGRRRASADAKVLVNSPGRPTRLPPGFQGTVYALKGRRDR